MPLPAEQTRREDCRRAVRAHLYARPAVSQSAATISRVLRLEHDFHEAEVSAAADFLVGLAHLTASHDPLGATKYYQISAEGILAEERA